MGSILDKAKSAKNYDRDESSGQELFIVRGSEVGPMAINTIIINLREEDERD